jgi:hypothetical protein
VALKQDIAKLKKLINQKDRTEFIQEFIKFKDTYFNKNFKQASIAIGESREKVGGIFDRAGVPQGGGGSLLTETTTTPKNVTKIQDLTTRLKYEPDFLKNQKKFKNLKGKYTAKDIGNLLEVDTSTKRNIDDLTATLKELGVKSSKVTGAIKEYDIKDTINKMSTGFLDKRVKGDVKDKTIRRGLEKKADPNLHRFFESLKGQIRSSSKEAGVYVPRANEDIGHSMSVVLQNKYPKLFKNSNVNTLSTFMYQDPVVNTTVLTKTGYDSNFDKILKDLNKLVNKPVTAESQKKLLNLKKQLDTNHKSVINLIKNPDQLKSFLSKYPETFNVKGVDFNYLKGQEKRIPKIDIKIPSVGEVFKSENLYADMSNTDPAFKIGNVDQINSNARTLKDLNLNERQLFRENVINQNVDNLSRFYTAVGFPKDEVVELTDTLITGGERSQGLSGTKSGIEKIDNSVNAYVKKVQSIPGGCQIVVRRALGNKGGLFNETCETIIKADPEKAAVKLNNAITATKGPLKDLKKDSQKMIRLYRGEEPARKTELYKATKGMPGMYDESLKGRFFFDNPADARYYAQRQGTLTGNVKSVDVPEKMVNIGRKMADRRRGPNYSSEVILPKKFVGKEKINIPQTAFARAQAITEGVTDKLKWDNIVGAFTTKDGDIATQADIKTYAAENPMDVKAGTQAVEAATNKSVISNVVKSLARVGAPLPVAAIDSYFIGQQVKEGKGTAEIASNPLNWLGLATMEPLAKVSGIAEPGKLNSILRLGLNPATIRGISRFAGLPGLAVSTAMTAYDQYQKYKDGEGFIFNLLNQKGTE